MEGFLNVDKPQWMSSHDVVQIVRRTLGLRKVGHAGTLDPMATGVLVVGVGRATRLIEYVQGRPKLYTTTVRLGQTTNTYDAEGEITQTRPVDVTDAQIEAALGQFRGEIEQVPPMFSAIKKDGQPLYKLARKGETIDIPARKVTISELTLLGRNGDDIDLQVGCTTGTYIRSLGHDLGNALGCGGHLVALRRTAIGKFTEADAVQIDAIDPAKLMRPDIAVDHFLRVDLDAAAEARIRVGQFIQREPADAADTIIDEKTLATCYTQSGEFLGLLAVRDALWKPHKLFV